MKHVRRSKGLVAIYLEGFPKQSIHRLLSFGSAIVSLDQNQDKIIMAAELARLFKFKDEELLCCEYKAIFPTDVYILGHRLTYVTCDK